jgi:hypothetical protein
VKTETHIGNVSGFGDAPVEFGLLDLDARFAQFRTGSQSLRLRRLEVAF